MGFIARREAGGGLCISHHTRFFPQYTRLGADAVWGSNVYGCYEKDTVVCEGSQEGESGHAVCTVYCAL